MTLWMIWLNNRILSFLSYFSTFLLFFSTSSFFTYYFITCYQHYFALEVKSKKELTFTRKSFWGKFFSLRHVLLLHLRFFLIDVIFYIVTFSPLIYFLMYYVLLIYVFQSILIWVSKTKFISSFYCVSLLQIRKKSMA